MNRRFKKKYITIFTLVALSLLAYRITSINRSCNNLSENQVYISALGHFKLNYGGEGTISKEDGGNYITYKKLPFPEADMYMDIYPDCCSYYPTQTSGYKTSFSDKYISGFCGFVEFTVHRRYVGASGTIEDALPYGLIWAVDYKYNIIEHPKRR